MTFNNSTDALNWLINNPSKKLYDKYANYYILSNSGNSIEYHHYELDYDDNGNDVSIWDYDLMNFSDFLSNDKELET